MSSSPQLVGAPDLDLSGMRREKLARIQTEMSRQGLAALWLLGPGHLRYVLGSVLWPTDAARGALQRPSLLITPNEEAPHLFTPYPEIAPRDHPSDQLHAPLADQGCGRAPDRRPF